MVAEGGETADVAPAPLWTAPWRLALSPLVLFRTSIVLVGILFVVRTMAIIVEGIVDLVFVLAADGGGVLAGGSLDLVELLVVAQRWGRVWTSAWMLIVVVPRLIELHQQSDVLTSRMGRGLQHNRDMHRRAVVVLLLAFLLGVLVTGVWQSFPDTWPRSVLALQRLWHSIVPAAAGPLGEWLLGPHKSFAQALLATNTLAWDAAAHASTTSLASLLEQAAGAGHAFVADLPYLVSHNARAISTWVTFALKLVLLVLMMLCVGFTADHVLENPIFQGLPGPAPPSLADMLHSVWRIFPPFRRPREARERFGDLLWSNVCFALVVMPDVALTNGALEWSLILLYCVGAALVQRLAPTRFAFLRQASTFAVFLLNFALYSWLILPVAPADGSCGSLCERSRADRVDVLEDLINRCARMATQHLLHITILTLMGWHMSTSDSGAFNPHVTSHLVYCARQIVRAPYVLLLRFCRMCLFAVVPEKPFVHFTGLVQSFLAVSLATEGNRRRQASVRNLSLHVGVIALLAVATLGAYRLHNNSESHASSDTLTWMNETTLYGVDTAARMVQPGVDLVHGMTVIPRESDHQSLLPACQFVFNQPPVHAANATAAGYVSPRPDLIAPDTRPPCTADEVFVPDRALRVQHLSVVADVVYGAAEGVPHAVDKLERLTGLVFQESLVNGLVNVWRQRGATVVAFRGTSSGGDVLTDVRIFLASVGLHFVLQGLPFMMPWRLLFTDDTLASLNLFLLRNQLLGVTVLNSILRLPSESDGGNGTAADETARAVFHKIASDDLFQRFVSVAHDVLRFVPRRGRHKVFLVGHSLGGAISQVVAHFLVEDLRQRGRGAGPNEVIVVPVAFNSPGIVWSQRLFGVHHPLLLERAININTAQDLVSSLDPPKANVQTLKCNDGPLLCHSMHRVNCILWNECSAVLPSNCAAFTRDPTSGAAADAAAESDPVRKVYLFLQLRWLLSCLVPAMLLGAAVVTFPLRAQTRRAKRPARSFSHGAGVAFELGSGSGSGSIGADGIGADGIGADSTDCVDGAMGGDDAAADSLRRRRRPG